MSEQSGYVSRDCLFREVGSLHQYMEVFERYVSGCRPRSDRYKDSSFDPRTAACPCAITSDSGYGNVSHRPSIPRILPTVRMMQVLLNTLVLSLVLSLSLSLSRLYLLCISYKETLGCGNGGYLFLCRPLLLPSPSSLTVLVEGLDRPQLWEN